MLNLAFFFSSVGSAGTRGAHETQWAISPHAMLKETSDPNGDLVPLLHPPPTYDEATAGAKIEILTNDDKEIRRRYRKTISVIVEEAKREFTFGKDGFQEFFKAFPEEKMNNIQESAGKRGLEIDTESLWLDVKKKLMVEMGKATCRVKLGAPSYANCANYGVSDCERDDMCYINEVIDLQFLNKDLAREVEKSLSGSKYLKYDLKARSDDKNNSANRREILYTAYERFNFRYRRARVHPKKKGVKGVLDYFYGDDTVKPKTTYIATELKDPSSYTSVEDFDFQKNALDPRYDTGVFFLHVDTKEPEDLVQLIQDTGKHAGHKVYVAGTTVMGYVGDLYNFWAPVKRPNGEGPQNYGDSIDSCPLVFQDNKSSNKVYMAATTIGTVVGWPTDRQRWSALAVFLKGGGNLTTSVEFRVVEVLRTRPKLYKEEDFDCAELKKADCKPEATQNKCAWEFPRFPSLAYLLGKETCTTRCPKDSYDAAKEYDEIPKNALEMSFEHTVETCAAKCDSNDNCKAFSFKRFTKRNLFNGCILLGDGKQVFQNTESFSYRVCLHRDRSRLHHIQITAAAA